MRDYDDSRRRTRRSYDDSDDFFRNFDNEETNIRALALVDQLLSSMKPKDTRRPLLYQDIPHSSFRFLIWSVKGRIGKK